MNVYLDLSKRENKSGIDAQIILAIIIPIIECSSDVVGLYHPKQEMTANMQIKSTTSYSSKGRSCIGFTWVAPFYERTACMTDTREDLPKRVQWRMF